MDVPRQRPKRNPVWMYGGVAASVLVVSLGLARLRPAAPSVERSTLWLDTVKRGDLVVEVRGPGTLVPEDLRIVSAMTAGRVERVLVQQGTKVEPATLLLELSNPDVQLEALDAERQFKVAEADLANLRSSLESQRLVAVSSVAAERTAFHEAERGVKVAERLAAEGLASGMEIERARDQLESARARYESEQARLEVLTEALRAQLALKRAEVERMQAIVQFQRERVGSMKVRAGQAGVVQSLALEPGQWVNPGQELARVAGQERLKAEIKIPEGEARDLTLGLPASVDTRNGIVRGHVSRIDPAVRNGSVAVDIALEGRLPKGARPDLTVDGTVEIDRLKDAVYVGRPTEGGGESTLRLYRLTKDGGSANRVVVRVGRVSYQSIQVLQGLQAGDRVILSDMSRWNGAERVTLR